MFLTVHGVNFVIDWWPAQAVPHFLLENSWDRLHQPATLYGIRHRRSIRMVRMPVTPCKWGKKYFFTLLINHMHNFKIFLLIN